MSATLLTDPVNHILLAGDPSPGLADVFSGRVEFEYQIHQAPASTGARILFLRRKLSEFDVRLRLYTVAHFEALERWKKHLLPPDHRGPAKAMDIVHPQLASIGVGSAVVKWHSMLEPYERGSWQMTIHFIQHIARPEVTMAKVEGSKEKPLTPIQKAILAQDKELEKLAVRIAS